MPIRYTKEILPLLKAAGYNTTRLRRERILSESTIQALRDGKVVSTDNLSRICATFWSTQKMMPDKGDKMASTEAQKRAVKKAQAKCDAIMLRPPKEEGAAIRAAAFAAGQSTQQYVLQAARERMEREAGE